MVDLVKRFEYLENLIICTQKQVLNIDELCSLTGLSKSTIYKLTMKGSIPHYKQSKHLYFDRVEIESWLKEHRGHNISELEQKAIGALTFKSKEERA